MSALKNTTALAFRAARIVPVTAPDLENGVLLVKDGKIEALGRSSEVKIPEEYEVIDLGEGVIYPGVIDCSSHLGNNKEPFNYYSETRDGLDDANIISPDMRAADAVNPSDRALNAARRFGITAVYSAVGHGNLVDGQGIVIKLRKGETASDLILPGTEQMNITLGSYVLMAVSQSKKPPKTRMGMMQMLRKTLDAAKKLAAAPAEEQEKADSAAKAMIPVVQGKMKARIYSEKAQDIVLAVNLAEEYGLDYTIDGAQEAFLMPEFMQEKKPVVVLDGIPFGPMQTTVADSYALDLHTAGMLHSWGCTLALTEDEVTNTARLPMLAGIQSAYGLPEEEAVKAITVTPARILGIADRTGSLEVGKDADLSVWSGNILDTLSLCRSTWVDGLKVYDYADR